MNLLLAAADAATGVMPGLSLGTGTVVLFAICAVLALLRGLLRMLLGTFALCISIFAGYLVWGRFPSFGGLPWLSWAVPAAAGIVVFLVLRKLIHFITSPLSLPGGGDRTMTGKALRMGFSLIPASALWLGGVAAVRHFGSIAEIRTYVAGENRTEPGPSASFLTEAKSIIDRYLPQDWLQKVDPLASDARITLAKLIARGEEAPPPKAIPVMQDPEIRSLILHDPQLRQLAREGRYADILRDPRLDRIVNDPDLRYLLSGLKLQ